MSLCVCDCLVCLRGDAHKEGLGYEREVLDTANVGYLGDKIRGYTTEDVSE